MRYLAQNTASRPHASHLRGARPSAGGSAASHHGHGTGGGASGSADSSESGG